MEAINFDSFISVANAVEARNKVNRNNADDEFLKYYCYQISKQMFSGSLSSDKSDTFVHNPVNKDLAIRLYAEALAKQIGGEKK